MKVMVFNISEVSYFNTKFKISELLEYLILYS